MPAVNVVYGHPHAFVIGNRNGNGLPVLRPENERSRFWRDADYAKRVRVEQHRGLLVHSGRGNTVEPTSAGCVIVWDHNGHQSKEWTRFRASAYLECRRNGRFVLLVTSRAALARFLADRKAGRQHRPTDHDAR